MKDPEACAQPGDPLLGDLIYGWGNKNWSAWDEYLAACIRHALVTSGPILECGSSLTTLLVGIIANERGRHYWALEHKSEWTKKIQRCLNEYKLDGVMICGNPLKDYGDYCWYDPPLESLPHDFSLVICDGPPASTKGRRYGLAPMMCKHLSHDSLILLDDAARAHERETANQWKSELGISAECVGSIKTYFEMRMLRKAQGTERQ